jgi:pyridoxal phosphate enzyme (YggS family)
MMSTTMKPLNPPDERLFPGFDDRLSALQARIASIDRDRTHEVRIVAVTKGFDHGAVEAVAASSCTAIGENYAQSILAKRDAIVESDLDLHFIGHLQSRKVRQVASLVTVWSSIDRASLIDELAKRAPGARMRLQVNTTGEPQKGGCPPDAIGELIDRARSHGLHVEGLMTVGPTDRPPEAARPAFALLRQLVDEHGLEACSMGMSADLAIAVEEGSTEVRIGTALFGRRPDRG